MKKYFFPAIAVLMMGSMLFAGSCKKADDDDDDTDDTDTSEVVIDTTDTGHTDTTSTSEGDSVPPAGVTNAPDQGMTMMAEDQAIYTYTSNSAENGDLQAPKTNTEAVPSCATVAVEGGVGVWPKILTIDFGTAGDCAGFDGRFRKGKIIAEFSGGWINHDVDDSIKVTLEGYEVNDTAISGTRYYWIQDHALIGGVLTVGMLVEDAGIYYPEGDSGTWQGTGTLVAENVNLDYTDDIVTYDFEGSGLDRYGNEYTFSTTDPVVSKGDCIESCPFVEGGLQVGVTVVQDSTAGGQELTLTTEVGVTIDYGDGTCDGVLHATTQSTTAILVNGIPGLVEDVEATYGPTEYACGVPVEEEAP